jgi:Arc/MetJ-type ribon-helix-helix transcriptional regulator
METGKKKQTRNKPSKYSKEMVCIRFTEEQLLLIDTIAKKDPKGSRSTAVRALIQHFLNTINDDRKLYEAIFNPVDEEQLIDDDDADEFIDDENTSIYDNY